VSGLCIHFILSKFISYNGKDEHGNKPVTSQLCCLSIQKMTPQMHPRCRCQESGCTAEVQKLCDMTAGILLRLRSFNLVWKDKVPGQLTSSTNTALHVRECSANGRKPQEVPRVYRKAQGVEHPFLDYMEATMS
jgi:hypothetical protein